MPSQHTPGQPLTVPQIATAFVEGRPIFVGMILMEPREYGGNYTLNGLLYLTTVGSIREAVPAQAWSGNVEVDAS